MPRSKSTVKFDGRAFVPETEYDALAARLAEAERLIDELNNHEGTEGWSHDLNLALAAFYESRV